MNSATAPYPLIGDIALMNAKPLILAAQSFVRGRRARFSHAAVAIDDEGYVDSLTGRGIGVGYWADLDPKMPIKILRYRPTEKTSYERITRMLEHYGKAYNFALALKNRPILKARFEDTYYCSEFVGQIFTKDELGVSHRKSMILPSDLEALSENPSWVNVTYIYKPYIDGTEVPHSQISGTGSMRLFELQGQVEVGLRRQRADFKEINRKIDELNAVFRGNAFPDLAPAQGGAFRKKWRKFRRP